MIAVVKIGGHQALVSAGEILQVDKLDLEIGKKVKLETLLISEDDGSKFQLGAPVLDIAIEAKVLEHGRDKKIRVFKMKPRKRYRRTLGHRQDFTVIEIGAIGTAKPVTKKAATKVAAEKPVKETVATKAKTTTKKAAPAKKPVAKKALAKKKTVAKKTPSKK
jgi:large subunit ribosomal protein L21